MSGSGFKPIRFGEVEKPLGVEKFKASTSKASVVSVISEDVAAVNVHYSPKVGFFYCFGGACCRELEAPSIKYILPIIEYNVMSVAEVKAKKYGDNFSLKYLSLSQKTYEDLITPLSLKGISPVGLDFLITCQDDKFQKMTIQELGPAAWVRLGLQDQISELMKEYELYIVSSVARTIDEAKFNEKYYAEDSGAVQHVVQSATSITPPGLGRAAQPQISRTSVASKTASIPGKVSSTIINTPVAEDPDTDVSMLSDAELDSLV